MMFVILLSITFQIVSLENQEHIQLLQNEQTLPKIVESEINSELLKKNIITDALENPQNSGIILLDYFNELIQEIAADSSLYDLIGFSIGMVIYGIFVYHFYRFLSKRDIFSINLERKIAESKFTSAGKKTTVAPRIAAFITTNLFIFPVVIFLWFIGYSSFMFLLVQTMPTSTIFLISSGLIIAIRISAYYSEDLSRDIAKLLPFSLLGIFLFNPQFYSISDLVSRFIEIPAFIVQIASFMVLIMAIEIVLSTIYLIKIRFFHKENISETDDHKAAV